MASFGRNGTAFECPHKLAGVAMTVQIAPDMWLDFCEHCAGIIRNQVLSEVAQKALEKELKLQVQESFRGKH